MNENKKVLFIINKYSGTGYRSQVEGAILSQCYQLGLEATLEFTKSRGHATELAHQGTLDKKYETIFAVGGDGTVNEVAKAVVHSNQVMGILPCGSGNGLARHLGIPMKIKDALPMIGSASVIAMDSMLVNEQLSINISGIGFDGHIAGMFGKDGKRGLISYSKLVLREFLRYKEFEVNFQIDDSSFHQKAFVIAFANSSQFGNNAHIAPHASVCDGLLDISVIRKIPLHQVAGFAAKMFSGQLHKSAFTDIKKGKRITLKFEEPMTYHIDGESQNPQDIFTIQMQPASIRMLVPIHSLSKV
jgi:diacylglycerol kinase (ATP)